MACSSASFSKAELRSWTYLQLSASLLQYKASKFTRSHHLAKAANLGAQRPGNEERAPWPGWPSGGGCTHRHRSCDSLLVVAIAAQRTSPGRLEPRCSPRARTRAHDGPRAGVGSWGQSAKVMDADLMRRRTQQPGPRKRRPRP